MVKELLFFYYQLNMNGEIKMATDIISKTKENEINLRLSNLKKTLSQMGEITIIGHDNIDVDSVLSGILLSKLFHYINIKARFSIMQPIQKNDTYQILSELTNIKMENYEELQENELRNLFWLIIMKQHIKVKLLDASIIIQQKKKTHINFHMYATVQQQLI